MKFRRILLNESFEYDFNDKDLFDTFKNYRIYATHGNDSFTFNDLYNYLRKPDGVDEITGKRYAAQPRVKVHFILTKWIEKGWVVIENSRFVFN